MQLWGFWQFRIPSNHSFIDGMDQAVHFYRIRLPPQGLSQESMQFFHCIPNRHIALSLNQRTSSATSPEVS
jgi:hypothetical protein